MSASLRPRSESKALLKYIVFVGGQLGLKGWTFHLLPTSPDDEDTVANCEPYFGRCHADLAFESDFRSRDSFDQKATVIHELLHCVFAQTQDNVRLGLVKHLSQSTYDAFTFSWFQMHEYAVDALAEALAAFFPDIDWPLR